MKKHYRTTLTLLLGGLFVFGCYLYMMDIETVPPSFPEGKEDQREVIHFGVISRYSPKQIIQGYQPLMDYLSEETPYEFKLRLSRHYMETVDQLVEGKVSFASLGNYTYVHASQDHGVKCIAIPLDENGRNENYDAMIVREDSPINKLVDLKGKTLAMASRYSFSAWMAMWMLQEVGISRQDLGAYTHLDHHDQVAEKVLQGEYDAGMVKALVATKYVDAGLRIIKISPPIPGVPLVTAANVSNEKVHVVQEALLTLRDKMEAGTLQTDNWDEEIKYGYGPGQDDQYDYPRRILTELDAWK